MHDAFRGVFGAWERAVQGIGHCLREGLGVQINMTVITSDIQAIHDVISRHRLGVKDFQVFFPVLTGRGTTAPVFSPQVYEELIRDVLVTYTGSGVNLRPTCAPQFRRIADTLGITSPLWGRGCIAVPGTAVFMPMVMLRPARTCRRVPGTCGRCRLKKYGRSRRSLRCSATRPCSPGNAGDASIRMSAGDAGRDF